MHCDTVQENTCFSQELQKFLALPELFSPTKKSSSQILTTAQVNSRINQKIERKQYKYKTEKWISDEKSSIQKLRKNPVSFPKQPQYVGSQ